MQKKDSRATKAGNLKKKALFWSLSIGIALIILLVNIRVTVFDKELFRSEFTKVGTYSRLGNADSLRDNIMNYFHGKENLDDKYFTEREVSHMQDVKVFLSNLNVMFYMLLVLIIVGIFLMYQLFTKDVLDYMVSLRNAAIICLAACLIIALLSFINFTDAFISFHTLFFKPGTYAFPETSTLIMLFPEQFFSDMFAAIIFRVCITSIIILGCTILFSYLMKKANVRCDA